MIELKRCQGGYPGGVHSYRDSVGEVHCPICGGTGFDANRRELAARVRELEAAFERLRVVVGMASLGVDQIVRETLGGES